MKILVLGLDSAVPEFLFGFDDLSNLRQLMQVGAYGRVESVTPPLTVPDWICLAASQDPGSLGIYGLRNRIDRSYAGLVVMNSRSIAAPAIWDQLACEGKRSILVGVPPADPPRPIHGISVGSFPTNETTSGIFTHPVEFSDEIRGLVGPDLADIERSRPDGRSELRDQIFAMSRTHFRVARHLMQTQPWDYFQVVDTGLDRVQRTFWKDHDPQHVFHVPGSPFHETIRAYYRQLDEEIGRVLELLSDETIVLVVSTHGARRRDGRFCVNQWLVRDGFLVLKGYPESVTPFSGLEVDWSKTKAWSEGGDVARIYLNVKGREPMGAIEPADAGRFRDELKARLEATTDAAGKPLGTVVYKPEEIYRHVRGVAPDLIAHLGGLAWGAIGEVGHSTLHVLDPGAGSGDCGPTTSGAFILAAPSSPLSGEIQNARLLDIAPTLLELAGAEVPACMQGQSLLKGAGQSPLQANHDPDESEDERLVRERLSGLGYI